MSIVTQRTTSIEHPGEEVSNDLRRRLTEVEPLGLRTYTPSLAILAPVRVHTIGLRKDESWRISRRVCWWPTSDTIRPAGGAACWITWG